MLRVIHSMPEGCPSCGSENLGDYQPLVLEYDDTVVCNSCGIVMVIEEPFDGDEESPVEADFEVSASFLTCPHCCTLNEIQVAEGEEWCGGCGLDPNRTDYPVADLAHLWKENSGIKASMERGIPKVNMSQLYTFLTKFCGPHCSFASECPQASGNFSTCFREEMVEKDSYELLNSEESEMGRGRKHRNREGRKERREEQKRISKEKERAVLVCASSGWYAERYYSENKNPQGPGNTGSGSGTQGVLENSLDNSEPGVRGS